MKIGDLPTGQCSLTLFLRKRGRMKVKGKVDESKRGKYLITHHSPKESFGPGTQVLRRWKEVKIDKK